MKSVNYTIGKPVPLRFQWFCELKIVQFQFRVYCFRSWINTFNGSSTLLKSKMSLRIRNRSLLAVLIVSRCVSSIAGQKNCRPTSKINRYTQHELYNQLEQPIIRYRKEEPSYLEPSKNEFRDRVDTALKGVLISWDMVAKKLDLSWFAWTASSFDLSASSFACSASSLACSAWRLAFSESSFALLNSTIFSLSSAVRADTSSASSRVWFSTFRFSSTKATFVWLSSSYIVDFSREIAAWTDKTFRTSRSSSLNASTEYEWRYKTAWRILRLTKGRHKRDLGCFDIKKGSVSALPIMLISASVVFVLARNNGQSEEFDHQCTAVIAYAARSLFCKLWKRSSVIPDVRLLVVPCRGIQHFHSHTSMLIHPY